MAAVTLDELTQELRAMLNDNMTAVNGVATQNILNGQVQQYSDLQLHLFLKMALNDVNATSPITNMDYISVWDPTMLVLGGMIFCFISEGILQLRNQVDYSDAGLTITLFNKTAAYQGWAGFLLQSYATSKTAFKRAVIPNSVGAGFYGIRSQFNNDWWGRY